MKNVSFMARLWGFNNGLKKQQTNKNTELHVIVEPFVLVYVYEVLVYVYYHYGVEHA